MRIFSFNSCRRSGCHPVAQWVGSLFEDDSVLYCHNNAGHVTDYITGGQFRPMRRPIREAGLGKPSAQHFIGQYVAAPNAPNLGQDFFNVTMPPDQQPPPQPQKNDLDLTDEVDPPPVIHSMRAVPENLVLIFGTENRSPREISISLPFTEPILNIRDPFNVWASVVKYSRKADSTMQSRRRPGQPQGMRALTFLTPPEMFSDLWCSYAKEYLGHTSFLGEHAIKINYNQWLEDQGYRKELAARFGREFTDRGFEDVPIHGAGSSFDGRNGSDRDYTSRWRRMLDDQRFCEVLRANVDIFQLAHHIWPELTEEVAQTLGVEYR